jgi:hypothetical protein
VNRLYQWLQQRLTVSRVNSSASRGPRIVRTQVTVEEQQRMVLLAMPPAGTVCLCPLCGNPVSALPPDRVGVVTLEHSEVHAQRSETQFGPGLTEQGNTPRPNEAGGTRRLR